MEGFGRGLVLLLLQMLLGFTSEAAEAVVMTDPVTVTDLSMQELSALTWGDSDLGEDLQGLTGSPSAGEEYALSSRQTHPSTGGDPHILEPPAEQQQHSSSRSSSSSKRLHAQGASLESVPLRRTPLKRRLLLLLAFVSFGAAMYFRGVSTGRQGLLESLRGQASYVGREYRTSTRRSRLESQLERARTLAVEFDMDSLHAIQNAAETLASLFRPSNMERDVLLLAQHAHAVENNIQYLISLDGSDEEEDEEEVEHQAAAVREMYESTSVLLQLTRTALARVCRAADHRRTEVFRYENFLNGAYEASLAVTEEGDEAAADTQNQLLRCARAAGQEGLQLQQVRVLQQQLKDRPIKTVAEMAAVLQAAASAATDAQSAAGRAVQFLESGMQHIMELTQPMGAAVRDLQQKTDLLRLSEAQAQVLVDHMTQEEKQQLQFARERLDEAIEELETVEVMRQTVHSPYTPGSIRDTFQEIKTRTREIRGNLREIEAFFTPFLTKLFARTGQEPTQP